MANLYSGSALGGGSMAVIRSGGEGDEPGSQGTLDGTSHTTGEVLRRILSHAGRHLPLLAVSIVASAASVILQLLVPSSSARRLITSSRPVRSTSQGS